MTLQLGAPGLGPYVSAEPNLEAYVADYDTISEIFHEDTREMTPPLDEWGIEVLERDLERDLEGLLVLPFDATNMGGFPFQWMNRRKTGQDHGSALVGIEGRYEHRL